MEKEITIEYTPKLETSIKVTRHVLLTLPLAKYILGIFLFLSFINIMSSTYEVLPNKSGFADSPAIPMLMFIAIWGFLYFISMRSAKNQILKNKKNLEKQKITLNKESLIQEGETFSTTYPWTDIHKIKETQLWFLIYVQAASVVPIIKTDLKGDQYNELKALFNSLNVTKSLK